MMKVLTSIVLSAPLALAVPMPNPRQLAFMDSEMVEAPEIIMSDDAPDPDFVPACDEEVVALYDRIWTNLQK